MWGLLRLDGEPSLKVSFEAVEQLSWTDLERLRHLENVVHGDVPLATLRISDVGRMKLTLISEPLLGPLTCLPELAKLLTKLHTPRGLGLGNHC
jgi:hypothetical protein